MEKKRLAPVKCRLCGKIINRNIERQDVDWVMGSRNYFYCKKCFDDWKVNKNNLKAVEKDEIFWYESLVDYLYREVKMEIDFSKLKHQWRTFTAPERKMTAKGIYFAVRYFYDVKKGDPSKSLGGIGIVPNIYNDSAKYWIELESKRRGTLEAITQQIINRKERPIERTYIKNKTKSKQRSKWSLDDI